MVLCLVVLVVALLLLENEIARGQRLVVRIQCWDLSTPWVNNGFITLFYLGYADQWREEFWPFCANLLNAFSIFVRVNLPWDRIKAGVVPLLLEMLGLPFVLVKSFR